MNTPRARRTRTAVGAALLLTLVASACGSDDDESDETTATTTAATTATTAASAPTSTEADEGSQTTDAPASTAGDEGGDVSLIYITPTPIGANPFLELGRVGTEAAADAAGGTSTTFESTDLNSRRANVEAAVEEAPTIIILNTFDFTDLAAEFSAANPDQEFILIDSCPPEPPANLHCGVFREYEGAYLLGIMAGMLSEAGKIGSVAALDIPFIHRYTDSFALGAQSVNPDITDSQVFIGGDNPFGDPARAKEQALALSAQGADHIFAVGAGSNGGTFEAATEEGFFTYGVDINECPSAPGQVVDNNLKLVDEVVEQLVKATLAGTAEPVVSFGLAEGAMGVIALQDDVADSGCVIADHPDVIEAVKAAAEDIISGDIVVPDPMAAG
jgi:basic membrane protein A